MFDFRFHRKVASLIVVLIFCLTAGSSVAATISYDTITPVTLSLTDWTDTLSFTQFDSSLGTLSMVELNLSGSLSTVLTIINSAPSGSNGTAKTEVQITVQDAGLNLNNPVIDLLSPDFTYSLGAGQTVVSGTITKNGLSSDQYTSAAVRSAFTGTGNILLNASTFTQTLLANTGGNTAASQITSAELGGAVTYHYEIPEPATIALLSLGGLLIRKKR